MLQNYEGNILNGDVKYGW